MSNCVELTAVNFEQAITAPIALIDFWMPGCPPCKMIEPVMNEIALDYDGRAFIGKINSSANMEIAMRYGVMSVPTLIIFQNGKEAERLVGFKPKVELSAWLDKYL